MYFVVHFMSLAASVTLRVAFFIAGMPPDGVIFLFVVRYNNKSSNLDTRVMIGWLQTLVKPENVKLSQSRISGKVVVDYVAVSSPWVIAERFANWRTDDASILRFTEQYGPLRLEWLNGCNFSFDVQEWREAQQLYRDGWKLTCPANLPPPDSLGITDMGEVARQVKLDEHSFLRVHKGSAALLVRDMKALLDVCQVFIPLERMRICPAKGCKKPYFVAHRLDQMLCGSAACKRWNELRIKQEWWNRNKGAKLSERRDQRRNRGTKKAR